MKVAVTGANGFIGSNICEVLRISGHRVIPLVRPELDNWKTLTVKIEDADVMVHCAWSGHPRNEVESQRNIYTSLTVAKAVNKARVPHMVFMSSGGGINSVTAYSSSKREVESLLSDEFDLFDFSLTVLRPTAVYGPGQDPNKGLGAVTTFIEAVRQDKTIHILGSPYSGRDFLHVRDLAEATCEVIEHRSFGTFEVGGPEVIQLNQLIKMIEGSFMRTAKVQIENPTGVDPQIIKLNNTLITKETGWVPRRRVADYIRSVR